MIVGEISNSGQGIAVGTRMDNSRRVGITLLMIGMVDQLMVRREDIMTIGILIEITIGISNGGIILSKISGKTIGVTIETITTINGIIIIVSNRMEISGIINIRDKITGASITGDTTLTEGIDLLLTFLMKLFIIGGDGWLTIEATGFGGWQLLLQPVFF